MLGAIGEVATGISAKLDGMTILTSVETVSWVERVTKWVFVMLAVTVTTLTIELGQIVEVELSAVQVRVPSPALQLEVSWAAAKAVAVIEGNVLVMALTLPLLPLQEWSFWSPWFHHPPPHPHPYSFVSQAVRKSWNAYISSISMTLMVLRMSDGRSDKSNSSDQITDLHNTRILRKDRQGLIDVLQRSGKE